MTLFRDMILLLIVWAILIVVATSCTTTPAQEYDEIKYNSACTTKIELRNQTKLEYPEDMNALVNAEEGCIRHYGPGSCLVKFIKTGKLSYYAICKRAPNK